MGPLGLQKAMNVKDMCKAMMNKQDQTLAVAHTKA